VKRSLASVGGTMAAADDALRTGFGGTLAGGTHHAFREYGSGFCVFNDIAVAICWLRAAGDGGFGFIQRPAGRSGGFGSTHRAAVLDLDVHQGDGTAAIFEHDPAVLTISVHGQNNFPFRKQRSKIDIELPDETGDETFLATLDPLLARLREFRPHIVFYQSGVDMLASDTLGRLALTHDGLKRRDQRVLSFCRDHALPVVITMGGGYANPIEDTVLAHANTYRMAAQVYGALAAAAHG
jgi:acetoin utilization deacetylase AcuC-like enzyme